MTAPSAHLIILPILLPLFAAAGMLLIDERRRRIKAAVSLTAMAAVLAVAGALLVRAASGTVDVYAVGAWPAPFGIVLVADRLAALMLMLTAVLASGALIFSVARWDRAGPRFHALFMLLVMGVNGAFLTGDLFNLFVFFEVMLAASYGLVLHGSGEARVRAGLHYVAVNLTASLMFLIGVGAIYGVAGTLNMADLAVRIPGVAPEARPMFHFGCAMMAMAFLIKAAAWPLGFWLPRTYAAASAPVAAVLAIMSKVGVYALIRLSVLLFGVGAGASYGFGDGWLLTIGLATLAFGAIGVLAARELTRAAGFSIVISSGTVIASLGAPGTRVLAGALVYMVASTLGAAILYLLADILTRRGAVAPAPETPQPVFVDEYQDPFDQETREDAVPIPAALAALGGAFLACTLILAGLPPLTGFLGKLAVFVGVLGPGAGRLSLADGVFVALLTLSSLTVMVALTRFGVAALWAPAGGPPLAVRKPEFAAVAFLLAVSLGLSIGGGALVRFADATVAAVSTPSAYVRPVLAGGAG